MGRTEPQPNMIGAPHLTRVLRAIRRAGVVALAVVAMDSSADACTCLPAGPACQAYWDVAAVFVGRVDSVKGAEKPTLLQRRVATLTVTESLKGGVSGTVRIATGSGGGDCGYPFKSGVEYVVYARRDPETGGLTTSICSRTRPIDLADTDLSYGRAIAAGETPPGRIGGVIQLRQDSLVPQRVPPPRPLRGITVLLDGNGQTLRRETNVDGAFEFENPGTGRFTARLELPPDFYTTALPREVALADARSCAEIDADVMHDGRVAGRVVDADGRPVPGLTIDLTVRSAIDRGMPARRLRTSTRGDGTYEVVHVPPGTFIVGINTEGDPATTEPRVFHPGVRELARARPVVVAAGQRVGAGDFALPRDVPYVPLTGVVLDADGAFAAGARVFLKGGGERTFILAEPVVTDASGRFTIAGLSGREYRLFAERIQPSEGKRRLENSDEVVITAQPGLPPSRLRLKPAY